jgi:glycyl-tRNA synthetase beta subunit
VQGKPRAFVLEIGTEELPPRDVVEATKQVKPKFFLHLTRQILIRMMILPSQIFLF